MWQKNAQGQYQSCVNKLNINGSEGERQERRIPHCSDVMYWARVENMLPTNESTTRNH